MDGAADAAIRTDLRKFRADLPTEYIAATSPQSAYQDLSELLKNREQARVKVRIEIGDARCSQYPAVCRPTVRHRCRRFCRRCITPAWRSTASRRIALPGKTDANFFVTSLTVDTQSAAKLVKPQVADAAQELFESLLNNEAEDGRLNGLVIEAGLRPKEVQVIRAYASYWRQAGSRFSLRYMADSLRKQPAQVRTLVEGFLARFNPEASAEQRAAGTAALSALKKNLADINHADTEDILRALPT